MTELDSDYLEHHGVKGQKWGVTRTPEQLGHAPKKKKKPTVWTKAAKAIKKKAAAKKKKDIKKDEVDANKLRDTLLKSADPKLVYKHRALLNDKELSERLSRINTEKKLKDLADSQTMTPEKFFKKGVDMGKQMEEVYKLYDGPMGKAVRRSLGFDVQDNRNNRNNR